MTNQVYFQFQSEKRTIFPICVFFLLWDYQTCPFRANICLWPYFVILNTIVSKIKLKPLFKVPNKMICSKHVFNKNPRFFIHGHYQAFFSFRSCCGFVWWNLSNLIYLSYWVPKPPVGANLVLISSLVLELLITHNKEGMWKCLKTS